jgi:ATP-dependent RNA helicase DOB1
MNIVRLENLKREVNRIETDQTQYLIKLLMKGIGYHHSGLVHPLKEIQEILFSQGLIKILFATETFSVGVNMPTRCVIFTELTKYDGTRNDFRYLNTSEYLQMAGRAGRRGKDTEGTVIYLPLKQPPKCVEMKNIEHLNNV